MVTIVQIYMVIKCNWSCFRINHTNHAYLQILSQSLFIFEPQNYYLEISKLWYFETKIIINTHHRFKMGLIIQTCMKLFYFITSWKTSTKIGTEKTNNIIRKYKTSCTRSATANYTNINWFKLFRTCFLRHFENTWCSRLLR